MSILKNVPEYVFTVAYEGNQGASLYQEVRMCKHVYVHVCREALPPRNLSSLTDPLHSPQKNSRALSKAVDNQQENSASAQAQSHCL